MNGGQVHIGSGKRFTTEQIIRKLREAEVLLAKGQTVAQVCRQIGVTDRILDHGGLSLRAPPAPAPSIRTLTYVSDPGPAGIGGRMAG